MCIRDSPSLPLSNDGGRNLRGEVMATAAGSGVKGDPLSHQGACGVREDVRTEATRRQEDRDSLDVADQVGARRGPIGPPREGV
eukprot:8672018-Alexandrium_andersonii.AAC.1